MTPRDREIQGRTVEQQSVITSAKVIDPCPTKSYIRSIQLLKGREMVAEKKSTQSVGGRRRTAVAVLKPVKYLTDEATNFTSYWNTTK